jgi:hypothetical protein
MEWAPTLLLGPCPESVREWPKFVSHAGHTVTCHVLVVIPQRVTLALDMAAMPELCPTSSPHMPNASLDVESTRALVELHSALPLALARLLFRLATTLSARLPLPTEQSSMATTRPASPCLPYPSHVPLHLHRRLPPSTRPSLGLSRHCRRSLPELLTSRHLLPWPAGHGSPQAEPSGSLVAHGTTSARAAVPLGPPPPVLACHRWP